MRWLVLVWTLAACSEDSHSGCTAILDSLDVQVVDLAGNPVDGLEHHTKRVSDGSEISLVQLSAEEGYYPAFSDAEMSELDGTLAIEVVVSDGQHSASTTGVVGTDEYGCHVRWSSEPEVITWRY